MPLSLSVSLLLLISNHLNLGLFNHLTAGSVSTELF